MNKLFASLFVVSTVLISAAPAISSAFVGGTVVNVPRGDKLYIRKWPASTSRIIDAYRRNELVSLTGRCKNIVTNVSFRIDTGRTPGRRYAMMEAPNVWCQVMTEDAELGWARGKFIWPQ